MPSIKRCTRLNVEALEDRCTPSIYTVRNLNDAGGGSLRQAIINANNHAGPDTVVFQDGLAGTIKLTSGQMDIKGSMTILGPGAGRIAVDGNTSTRVFFVLDNGNGIADVNVKIQGLKLRNGLGDYGGAVVSAENLALVNMVLVGNRADFGGAVSAAGNLTIRQCTISGNTAAGLGGGVHFNGNRLTVQQSVIASNKVLGTVAGNPSYRDGGGLYLNIGTAVIRNCVISGNAASSGWGGGLAASRLFTDLTIANSTIDGNQANQGGGVHSFASTTITDSKIRYNFARSNAGGLASFGDTQMRRSTVSGNIVGTGSAGGIQQNGGSLVLLDSTVNGNRALSGIGGGVKLLFTNSNSIIRRSTVAVNRAADGGGLAVVDASFTIQNSTISGNTASANGGGLYVSNSPKALIIQNSTIAFNRAAISGGGILSYSVVNLDSTIVANNSASDALGRDLADASGRQSFNLTSCLISTGFVVSAFADLGNNRFGVDPRLAPLANNGGLTQTHALKNGSKAINHGFNPAGLTTDQRGGAFKRKLGKQVDIGAFERE